MGDQRLLFCLQGSVDVIVVLNVPYIVVFQVGGVGGKTVFSFRIEFCRRSTSRSEAEPELLTGSDLSQDLHITNVQATPATVSHELKQTITISIS